MDIQWRPSKAVPDLEKMFAHYRRTVGKSKTEDFAPFGGWEGFIRKEDDRTVTQVGRYFEASHRLVELAIVWPGPRDKALERKLLTGIGPHEQDSDRRTWQALGLAVAVPRGLPMKGYLAQPGRIRFDFLGKLGRLSVSRVAMVDYWLKQPVADWLAEQAPPDARLDHGQECIINGHQGQELLTSQRGRGLDLLLGRRRWEYRRAWICPRSERFYLLEWMYTGRQSLSAPEVTIGCCGPLSGAGD